MQTYLVSAADEFGGEEEFEIEVSDDHAAIRAAESAVEDWVKAGEWPAGTRREVSANFSVAGGPRRRLIVEVVEADEA